MNISARVSRHSVPGAEMLSVASSVPELVMLSGSFLGGAAHVENRMVPGAAAAMLKEGTRQKSKEKIREILESRGARITFSAGELATAFSLVCLASDFPVILSLLKELLEEPAFPAKELEMSRVRQIAGIEEMKQDTTDMAVNTLIREMFRPGHPHRNPSPDEAILMSRRMGVRDLAAFHKKFYGRSPARLAFAGPQDEKIIRSVLKVFENRSAKDPILPAEGRISNGPVSRSVEIKDKTSATFVVGQPVSVKKHDPDFLALRAGIEALGGDFGARLVQEVREKRGLTYGTYANFNRATIEFPGFFQASATFAPALLQEGESLVCATIEKWWKDGLGEKELAERKETMRGSYVVWLSSMRNLVATLLTLLEDRKDPVFIDQLLSDIDKLTLSQVNAAIRKHIDPKKFVSVRAGSLLTYKK